MGIQISNNSNLPIYIWECSNISPKLAENCGSSIIYDWSPEYLKSIKVGWSAPSNSASELSNNATPVPYWPKVNYLYIGETITTRKLYNCPSNSVKKINSAIYTWKIYKKISTCPPPPPPPACAKWAPFTLEKGPVVSTSNGCMVQTYICKFSSSSLNSSCCMDIAGTCRTCQKDEQCKPTNTISKRINGTMYSWGAGACTKFLQCPEPKPCDSCDPRGCPSNPTGCCQWSSYIHTYPNGCQRTCWKCTQACPKPPSPAPIAQPPSNIPPGTCYNGFSLGPESLWYRQGLIPLCKPLTPTVSPPLAPHPGVGSNNDPCGNLACVSGPAGKFCGYWTCNNVDLALGKKIAGLNCFRKRPPGCTGSCVPHPCTGPSGAF